MLLYLVGTLTQSLSPTFATIILGRIIYGLGIGTAMHVAPLYIAETAPSDLRGKLVSLKEAAIVAGIIVGYLAGASLGGQSPSFSIEGIESWRTMFLTALPLELAMAVGAFGLAPESPRWLALRQRSEEAEEALVRCQGLEAQDAKQQVEAMTRASASETVGGEDGGVSGQFAEIFDSPYNKGSLHRGRPGAAAAAKRPAQRALLRQPHLRKCWLGLRGGCGRGLFKLVMTIISSFLVENPNFGRKTLLLYGNIGVTLSLGGLTALYGLASSEGLTPTPLSLASSHSWAATKWVSAPSHG